MSPETREKRKTWRDRPRRSLAFKIDMILKSGARYIFEGKPFVSKATPEQATAAIVRTLALCFGGRAIERACARGIEEARRWERARKAKLK